MQEIFKLVEDKYNAECNVLISEKLEGVTELEENVLALCRYLPFLSLYSKHSIIRVENKFNIFDKVLLRTDAYKPLADAIFISDNKNILEEKDVLTKNMLYLSLDDIKIEAYAFILALSQKFIKEGTNLDNIFLFHTDFVSKLNSYEDSKSITIYINNLISNVTEKMNIQFSGESASVVSKAKRYINDNYQNANLMLADVATFVGLNEKYFTTLFTKENGENFQTYLTGLRIQNAKVLLRTTTFKIYEVSEMVGYANPEHFTRTFRKVTGVSPASFRKDSNI